ncbi:hypothetical protein B0T22DRAFT_441057 [Podospora appendiculata]|uniref:Uncharacterized protein n=1 Tax=Podospora appendiculata TaxID=314037 RepID=A0AAE0XBD3_9PEZI|nr:hypothetical protein B0T22DRAFT_441057 [Podospora appendiculata]
MSTSAFMLGALPMPPELKSISDRDPDEASRLRSIQHSISVLGAHGVRIPREHLASYLQIACRLASESVMRLYIHAKDPPTNGRLSHKMHLQLMDERLWQLHFQAPYQFSCGHITNSTELPFSAEYDKYYRSFMANRQASAVLTPAPVTAKQQVSQIEPNSVKPRAPRSKTAPVAPVQATPTPAPVTALPSNDSQSESTSNEPSRSRYNSLVPWTPSSKMSRKRPFLTGCVSYSARDFMSQAHLQEHVQRIFLLLDQYCKVAAKNPTDFPPIHHYMEDNLEALLKKNIREGVGKYSLRSEDDDANQEKPGVRSVMDVISHR